MILKYVSSFGYKIRKARVITQNKLSVVQYRKDLRQARRKVHQQAKQYQNMIQDQYLLKHAEQTKLKHFQNQCDFRKRISQDAFKLNQNLKRWKREDQKKQSKLNKFLHQEDLKRINRERIKKIMTYESQNFWYNAENAQQRLTEQVIFPAYVGSTQYYHKLHMEALAYQNFDFNMLNKVTSTEQVVKQKNKYLIPLFNEIKLKIKDYKANVQNQLKHQYQLQMDRIKYDQKLSESEKEKLFKEQEQTYNQSINAYFDKLQNPVKRLNYTKQKLRTLVSLLGAWKQYTSILSMTSGQMMKNIQEGNEQQRITDIRKNILKNIKLEKTTTFIDPIQEDTEQNEITLQQYLKELRRAQNVKKEAFQVSESISSMELKELLNDTQKQMRETNVDSTKVQEKVKINLQGLVKEMKDESFYNKNEIPMSYLNVQQTTSGVEIMKELYKDDNEMIKLLNQIGEVVVDYPKLFKKIWDNTHTL